MSTIILFPNPRPLDSPRCLFCSEPLNGPDCCGEDEYDPNDPGVLMSDYLAEFNRLNPDYDRLEPNADELPF